MPSFAVLVAALTASSPLSGVVEGESTCPSPAAVQQALQARPPAFNAPARASLRIQLAQTAEHLNVLLRDDRDQPVLQRSFALVPHACGALADTVALVVNRHVEQLVYRAPASPTPMVDEERPVLSASAMPVDSPTWLLAASGTVWTTPVAAQVGVPIARLEPALGAWVHGRKLVGMAAFGLSMPVASAGTQGAEQSLLLRTASARVGLGLRHSMGLVVTSVTLSPGVQVHALTAGSSDQTQRMWRWEPITETQWLAIVPWQSVFVGLGLTVAASWRPRTFVSPQEAVLLATPRLYAGLSLLIGWTPS